MIRNPGSRKTAPKQQHMLWVMGSDVMDNDVMGSSAPQVDIDNRTEHVRYLSYNVRVLSTVDGTCKVTACTTYYYLSTVPWYGKLLFLSQMANRVGTRRRKLSDEEFVELSLPAPPSARPPSARRAAAALAASEELADVLTPEEEYLIRVFRRYRQQTTSTSPHTTQGGENKKVMSSNRLSAKLSDSDRVVDRNSTLPAATAKTPVQPAGCGGEEAKATGLARNKEVLVPPAPQQPTVAPPTPTDTASRLKLLLEKKRKAAATGSTRVGAAASGAGVQRKAKISKVVGASSSATSARLDSVKVIFGATSTATGRVIWRVVRKPRHTCCFDRSMLLNWC